VIVGEVAGQDAAQVPLTQDARQTLLEICAREGIPAHERDLSLYDVYTADEVFFCSTMVTVMAVTEVDGRRIGSGHRVPMTKRPYEAFLRELTTGPNLTEALVLEAQPRPS
jgi:Amino-transferase class IV